MDMDEQRADRALVAVFNELIALGREAKQGAWAVPRGAVQESVDDLMTFLFTHAAAVADAEAAIDGRSPDMISPSAHGAPQLMVDARGADDVVPLLIERARKLSAAIRTRATDLGASEVGRLLDDVAEGLDKHVEALAATTDSRSE
jgi:hypothetical protein